MVAAGLGCNVVDTASNYRFQRSGPDRGRGAGAQLAEAGTPREQIVVCSKAGFIPSTATTPWTRDGGGGELMNPGIIRREDVVAGCRCVTPDLFKAPTVAEPEEHGAGVH